MHDKNYSAISVNKNVHTKYQSSGNYPKITDVNRVAVRRIQTKRFLLSNQGRLSILSLGNKNIQFEEIAGNTSGYKINLKDSIRPLIDAAAELFKQNFLGSDINMEFLVLSFRVHMIWLADLANYYSRGLRMD